LLLLVDWRNTVSMSTIAEASGHLFLSETRFKQLLDSGVIDRQPANGYCLTTVRRSYVEHLRGIASARGSSTSLAAERTGLAAAQRQIAEMELAAMAGQFVSIEEAGQEIEAEYGNVRQLLLGIPGSIAAQLVGLDRAEIEVALDAKVAEILRELSTADEIIARVQPDTATAGRGSGGTAEAAASAAGGSPGAGAADGDGG
jgi:phage terminase Nu1 subunit (DNA packaging protein)